ncbi:MAG: hypothetical protein AAGG56_13665 [Pseudomonadota bacterium]
MASLRIIATIAFAVFGGAAMTAQAADSLECTDQDLLMTNESITFLGDVAEGARVGDRRVLNWRIHAPDGSDLGNFHVVTTVLGADEGGHTITAVGSADFLNGEIHAAVTALLPNASDEDQSSSAPVDWAITGGTGDFAHAAGTLLTGPPADDNLSLNDWVFELRMRCDG